MLHTYQVDSRASGHDAESWSDAHAVAASICSAVYDAADGDFFVVADDDSDEEMRAVRDLIAVDPASFADRADPAGYIVDNLLPVTDARGNMRLVRKFISYKSDPRDPELWTEHTLDELREIKRELEEIKPRSWDTEWSRSVLEVDRAGVEEAIKRAEQGERIFVAIDEDGYYFAA